MKRHCLSCIHWDPVAMGMLGQCLNKPSKIISEPEVGSARVFYRTTYPDDFCEDWTDDTYLRRMDEDDDG